MKVVAAAASSELSQNGQTEAPTERSSITSSTTMMGGIDHHHPEQKGHRLDFSRVKFCGRSQQVALLQETFEKATTQKTTQKHQRRQPVPCAFYIQGGAGCGKSALVEHFWEQVAQEQQEQEANHVFFGWGKNEEGQQASAPFAAILDAMNQILACLRHTTERAEWKQRILHALDSERQVAEKLFPLLREMDQAQTLFMSPNGESHDDCSSIGSLGDSDDQDNDELDATLVSSNREIQLQTPDNRTGYRKEDRDKDFGFERLKVVFRSILRTISVRHPVILALDDMQWSDKDSLALVKTLLQDKLPDRRVLFVFVSRPLQANSPFTLLWKETDIEGKIAIKLDNLSYKETTDLVSNVVGSDLIAAGSLAEAVFKKTGGNPLFVRHFLYHLHQEGLLHYSMEKGTWDWDAKRIVSETDVSDNVFEILAKKLETLSGSQQSALTTAAFLQASKFDVTTIYHAMISSDTAWVDNDVDSYIDTSTGLSLESLQGIFEDATNVGLLEELGPGQFKFAHDRVREAIYNRVPGGRVKSSLHLRIGRLLRAWLEDLNETATSFDHTLILQIANQMNLGADQIFDTWEKLDLAEINYDAAEFASEQKSFNPALDFLEAGLSHIPGGNPWQDHYDTMVKHSAALTRVYFCCGKLRASVEMADIVLKNAKTFEEARVAYHTKILCIIQLGRTDEALHMTLSALRELGVPFPKHFLTIHVLANILRTRRMFRGRSDEGLLNLPAAETTGNLRDLINHLERLGEMALHGSCRREYLPLVLIRIAQLSLERGSNPSTPFGFSTWAAVNHLTGNYQDADRFAKLTRAIVAKRGGMKCNQDARAMSAMDLWIGAWKDPVHECVERAGEAIQFLREHGAMEYLVQEYPTYLFSHLTSGICLRDLTQHCNKYMELLRDLKQNLHSTMFAPFCQCVANLQSTEGYTVQLTGEFMDEPECLEKWTRTGNEGALRFFYLYGAIAAFFLGDIKRATELSSMIRADKGEPPTQLLPYRCFIRGMIALDRSNYCSKKYQRLAASCIRQLDANVRKGLTNSKPLVLLLRAERLAVTSSWNTRSHAKIQRAFDEAISESTRVGFVQHAALANERAGLFWLKQRRDRELTSKYLIAAREGFERWGALAKVQKMSDEYGDLLFGKTHSTCVPSAVENPCRPSNGDWTVSGDVPFEYDKRSHAVESSPATQW